MRVPYAKKWQKEADKLRQIVLECGLSEDEIVEWEQEIDREVDISTQEAKDGDMPREDLLLRDVWADGGSAWRC